GRAAASVRTHCGRQSLTNTIVQWPWGDTHAPITCALFAHVINTSSRTSAMDAVVLAGSSGKKWRRQNDHTRLSRQTVPIRDETAPSGTAPDHGLSRVVRRAHSAHPIARMDLRARSGGWYEDRVVELGGVSCAWSDGGHGGYSLCDALVEVRH